MASKSVSCSNQRLIYFGHHKCATQYIKAVVKEVSSWLGLNFAIIDRPVEPASATAGNPIPHHRLHVKDRGYIEPTEEFLYFANANTAAVDALRERGDYRGFHVIRDPRDILASAYFSHLYSHPITEYNRERMTDWRRLLAEAPSMEAGLLLEIDFIAPFLANMAGWRYDDPNTYETRYETLTVHPLNTFIQIFRFLGVEVSRLGLFTTAAMLMEWRLKCWCGLPRTRRNCLPQPALRRILAQNAFERKSGGRLPGQENDRHHYRKGLAGDWRNYFTPQIKAAFKERYGSLLIQLGYEQSLDW